MKVGFIGCGNMAQAIMGGLIRANIADRNDIYGSDISNETLKKVERELQIHIASDNLEIAKECDTIILAVKPQSYPKVIKEISKNIDERTLIISIAPGKTLADLQELFGHPVHLVRTMPNTPALIGEAMTAMCVNEFVTKDDEEKAAKILKSFGRVETVEEYMMDAVVAVSGSAPAYVFMLLEAMADAAVLKGMPRQTAYTFAAQTVMGSAKMLLELKKHPGELKDMVTSPAGTTIEAVRVLERDGFRSAMMEAMIACADRSSKL